MHNRQARVIPFPSRLSASTVSAHLLLWQKPDGTTAVLDIVEEDARSIGTVTWKGLEFLNAHDVAREELLKPGRRASRSRITSKMHASVVRAEHNRAANEMGGLEGATARSARSNAEAQQDARRGAAQAEAYGIAAAEVTVCGTESATRGEPTAAPESSYLRRLAQRLMGQNPAQENPQQR